MKVLTAAKIAVSALTEITKLEQASATLHRHGIEHSTSEVSKATTMLRTHARTDLKEALTILEKEIQSTK